MDTEALVRSSSSAFIAPLWFHWELRIRASREDFDGWQSDGHKEITRLPLWPFAPLWLKEGAQYWHRRSFDPRAPVTQDRTCPDRIYLGFQRYARFEFSAKTFVSAARPFSVK